MVNKSHTWYFFYFCNIYIKKSCMKKKKGISRYFLPNWCQIVYHYLNMFSYKIKTKHKRFIIAYILVDLFKF